MERNVLLDIGESLRPVFLICVSLGAVLLLAAISEPFYRRFGVKLDAYLLRMFKRWDERKARKAR